ncbi:MAG TPA: alpha-1,2-fucosyltransferase [Candidatus Paceibacterota bacterium]|nr:alpha-1,2-fucosyltransferase [Candidatus Paceibacterota bacterium]HMO82769.1 alpha-1,2-fucosyltransferase [Candidatus Paceibacterota bacterium]
MIIINLKGGLGNQMFQYAFGRALSIKNNDILKLDIHSLDQAKRIGNIYRPFSLALFNIQQDLASLADIAASKKPEGLLTKITRRIKNSLWGDQTNLFKAEYLNQKGNLYLDGYFQSPLYFENIRDLLLKEFTLKVPLPEYGRNILEQMQLSNSVSLHIRRGDYLSNLIVKKQFGPCTKDYYQRAIDKLKTEVKDAKFFVFSDDIAWVKNNLELDEDTVFVSDPSLKDAEELSLMSQCQHNIIANSSFSWWGAWLNQNPSKLVIAPTPWFDTIDYDPNLLPSSWIQLAK